MIGVPIAAAALTRDTEGRLVVPAYRDRAKATQIDSIFLKGNDLPARWQSSARFVVLAIGFGAGDAFLATWRLWRASASRPARLVYLAIEPEPLARADLQALHADATDAQALCAAWPALTSNLHRLAFDRGQVQLLLAFGAPRDWLPELVAEVDAFYLDGMTGDADVRRCKALGRLAAPGATLAAHGAPAMLAAHLRSAGFHALPAPSGGVLARFEPLFQPRRSVARMPRRAGIERHAVIVGAGLAGCATACALSELGWRSTLLERRPRQAAEASGNPGGIFHGIVNRQDGIHARFNRAAAMRVAQEVDLALRDGVRGARDGLLRLEHDLSPEAMRQLIAQAGLPGDYVLAVGAAEASALAGRPLNSPAWFYPGGGWVDPAELAAHYLRRADGAEACRFDLAVHALERTSGGWRLLGAQGDVITESPTVVLANACDATRLLGHPAWQTEAVRGQISLARSGSFALPRRPIAGRGYLLPDLDGQAMFGATSQPGDLDESVREADHLLNLLQLDRLLGSASRLTPDKLSGRTGWRCSAPDRLPLIGAVPDKHSIGPRQETPRLVPRLPGLYVITALGSRGIAWSAIGAQVLAAGIAGAPVPLEASLLDAIDPARFISRRARQSMP